MGKKHSKRAFRKLDTSEIDRARDDAEDLAIIDAAIAANDTTPLFIVDAEGKETKGLSTRQKKLIRKTEKTPRGWERFSASERKKISKVNLSARVSTGTGSKSPQVFDLWASDGTQEPREAKQEGDAKVYENSKLLARVACVDLPRHLSSTNTFIPAVPYAHPGQSFNPSEELQNDAIAAAAIPNISSTVDNLQMQQREVAPLYTELKKIVNPELLSQMDDMTRQRVYAMFMCDGSVDFDKVKGETEHVTADAADKGGDVSDVDSVSANEDQKVAHASPENGDSSTGITVATDDGDVAALADSNETIRVKAEEDEEKKEAECGFKRPRTDRKTKAQRNKAKRRKIANTVKDYENSRLEVLRQIENLEDLMKLLQSEEEGRRKRHELQEKRLTEDMAAERKGRLRRLLKLGKHRFVEPPMVVNFQGEASGSLRQLALPSSSVAVSERMTSLQRRGVVPAAPQLNESYFHALKRSLWQKKRARKLKTKSPLVQALRSGLLK